MVKIIRLKEFKVFNDGTRGKIDSSLNNDRESRVKEYTLQLTYYFDVKLYYAN